MSSSCLIGCTGFVGSNLLAAHAFDCAYNSQTVQAAYGQKFRLVVCAAPQARKWWANQHPNLDREMIDNLVKDLHQIEADRFVLISTIDVFPIVEGVDERFDCTSLPNHAYGRHRLYLEELVRAQFPAAHIVRLPGLFGRGIKKNVIYDLLNDNDLNKIHPESRFQWYDLSRLWQDLEKVLAACLDLVVLATEPIGTEEIRKRFFPWKTIGANFGSPARYDMRSIHANVFGGSHGYVMNRSEIIDRLGRYLAAEGGALA